MGKASTKAQNKYISKAYDRINLTMPKEKRTLFRPTPPSGVSA